MGKIEYYEAKVECSNCYFNDSNYISSSKMPLFKIKKGIPVSKVPCPRCGCKDLNSIRGVLMGTDSEAIFVYPLLKEAK